MAERTSMLMHVFVACVLLFLFAYPYPFVFGDWESSLVNLIYNPERWPSLFWPIIYGGNTAGNYGSFGQTYPSLALARWISDYFGHGVWIVRLVPASFGLGSLGLLYVIARRWFGRESAIFSVALLSTNSFFLVYQHSLLPQIPTLFFLFLVLERFQALLRDRSLWAAVSLGVACSLLAPHYIIGRFCLLAILATLTLNLFDLMSPDKAGRVSLGRHLLLVVVVLATMITVCTVMYPFNPMFLFTPEYLFPAQKEYGTNAQEILGNLFRNIRYFYDFYVWPETTGRPSDLIATVTYPVESWFGWTLFLSGLVGLVRGWRTPAKSLLVAMLVFVFLLCLLSSVNPQYPYWISCTMLPTRVFFVVPFVCLVAGFGMHCLMQIFRRHARWLPLAATGVFVMVMIARTSAVPIENARYEKRMDLIVSQGEDGLPSVRETLGTPSFTRQTKIDYDFNQLYYKRLARHIAALVQSRVIGGGMPVVVYTPYAQFMPDWYVMGSGRPSRDKASFPYALKIFLNHYLNDDGVASAYLVPKSRVLENEGAVLESLRKGGGTGPLVRRLERHPWGRMALAWLDFLFSPLKAAMLEDSGIPGYVLNVPEWAGAPAVILATEAEEVSVARTLPGMTVVDVSLKDVLSESMDRETP